MFLNRLEVKLFIAFSHSEDKITSLIYNFSCFSVKVNILVNSTLFSIDFKFKVGKLDIVPSSLSYSKKYAHKTREKSLFFDIEPSTFMINLVRLIWSFKSSHQPKGVLINLFFFFLDLLVDLNLRLWSCHILAKVIKIRCSNWWVQHRFEHLLLLLLFRLHYRSWKLIITKQGFYQR